MRHPQELYGDPDLKLEGLSIWALAREFPNSEDFWDGNWITVHAHVEAPGARVAVRGPWLRSDEVERFLDRLEALNQELKGVAELACIEPTLNVKVTCGSLGHIQIAVEITPDHLSLSEPSLRVLFGPNVSCISDDRMSEHSGQISGQKASRSMNVS
jgi:hypothetical protein